MKTLIVSLLAFGSVSVFAGYVDGKGKVTVSSGFYPSAKDSSGANIRITGKAAKVLFNEIEFAKEMTNAAGEVAAEDATGAFSGQQIRQSDFIQCVKYSERDIECRMLMNSDGTPAKLPRLHLNN